MRPSTEGSCRLQAAQKLTINQPASRVGDFAIDPRSDLAAHFRSPRTSGDATGYKNDQVDALFAQAATAVSQEEQKRIYDQIQMLAEGDAVYAYLIRPKVLEVNVKALSLPQAKIQAEIYDGMPQWGLS